MPTTLLSVRTWQDWWARSVANRATLMAAALTMLVALAIGTIAFVTVYRQIAGNANAGLANRAELMQQQLASDLNVIVRNLADLSANSFIASGLVDSVGRDTYLQPFLRDHRIPVDTAIDLVLSDFRGEPVAANRSVDLAPFRNLSRRSEVLASGRAQAQLVGRELFLLEPVFFPPTGRSEGLLIGRLSLDALFLKQAATLGGDEWAEFYVADALFAAQDPLAPPDETFAARRTLAYLVPPLDSAAIAIEVKRDSAQTYAHLGQALALYLVLVLLTLLVVTWAARLLARRLTAPLAALSHTADAIASGGLAGSAGAPVYGQDEVGRLGVAFNAMLERLRVLQGNLEQRVVERTHELEIASQRLSLVLEATEEGVWDWQVQSGELYNSPTGARLLGYEADELDGTFDQFRRCLLDEDVAGVFAAIEATLSGSTGRFNLEHRMRRKDGKLVWVANRGSVVARDAAGRPTRMLGTISDISERRQGEEKLRAALAERESLLREVHHRVKNNLAVIGSLIALQGESVADDETRGKLAELQERARVMALVHEHLYRSESLARIDFARYLESLIREIVSTRGHAEAIRLELDVPDVTLDIEQAMPCGMIVNELLSNIYKYAFPPARLAAGNCTVKVGLRSEDGQLRLTVADNGVGLPAAFDWQSASTLGLQLVHALARQIGARVEIERAGGTAFTFRFGERAR